MIGLDRVAPRDRKVLAVGSLSVAFLLGVGKGLPALRAWEGVRLEAAAEAHKRVLLAETSLARLAELRDSAAARGQQLIPLRAGLLSAATPEAAAAAQAALLERIADDANVAVSMVMLRPDTTAHFGLVRVATRLTFEGDIAGVSSFLLAVETHETPFIVRELSITQPDVAAPDSRPETLHADVLVQTLARIRPPMAKTGVKSEVRRR